MFVLRLAQHERRNNEANFRDSTVAAMLSVDAIDVCYGESRILTHLDLTVGPGQVVCVMGRNGVGKTTLLKAIMGLLVPPRGRIVFRGQEITRLPPYERARRGTGDGPPGRGVFPAPPLRGDRGVGGRRGGPAPAGRA